MVYINPITPNIYDSTSILIDTARLRDALATITIAVNNVADNLISINNTLGGLTLDWLGNASDQAQAYNDEWNNVVQLLYGAMDSNGNQTVNDGALSVLVTGLAQAIQNYNANEQAVAKLFNGVGSTNESPTESHDDVPSHPFLSQTGVQEYVFHTTAVNEDF
jgi:hypothetical protein